MGFKWPFGGKRFLWFEVVGVFFLLLIKVSIMD